MLFELAYPGLCAWALLRRATGRPTPAGPLFAFRAIRGRMRRYELSGLTALNLTLPPDLGFLPLSISMYYDEPSGIMRILQHRLAH